MAPPTMAQQLNQQYQQPQQPYMMMQPQPQAQPQPQHAPMWAPSAQPPPQSVPPPQQVQPASADEVRTLWIGDLQYWMDENYIYTCFAHTGEVYLTPFFCLFFYSILFFEFFNSKVRFEIDYAVVKLSGGVTGVYDMTMRLH